MKKVRILFDSKPFTQRGDVVTLYEDVNELTRLSDDGRISEKELNIASQYLDFDKECIGFAFSRLKDSDVKLTPIYELEAEEI